MSAIAFINKAIDIGDSQGTFKALSAPNACVGDLDEENSDRYQKSLEEAKTAKKEVRICFGYERSTLKCLSIGTPKAINFPFVSNEKMFLGVLVLKHIVMRL